MIACINYFLGLNQHQSGGLGQMVEIVIIWPAFRSLNVAHGFISDIIDGSQLKYPSWSTEIVRFFFFALSCVVYSFCSHLHSVEGRTRCCPQVPVFAVTHSAG